MRFLYHRPGQAPNVLFVLLLDFSVKKAWNMWLVLYGVHWQNFEVIHAELQEKPHKSQTETGTELHDLMAYNSLACMHPHTNRTRRTYKYLSSIMYDRMTPEHWARTPHHHIWSIYLQIAALHAMTSQIPSRRWHSSLLAQHFRPNWPSL